MNVKYVKINLDQINKINALKFKKLIIVIFSNKLILMIVYNVIINLFYKMENVN